MPAKRATARKNQRTKAKPKPAKVGRPRAKLASKDKLRWAAQLGYRDVVEELLAKGENPNVDQGGSTPLAMACFHRKVAIVRVLLAAGADPNFAVDTPPLVYAVTSGSKRAVEMVRMLLDAGAKPNPPAYRGLSLIAWCARDSRLAEIKGVLERARSG